MNGGLSNVGGIIGYMSSSSFKNISNSYSNANINGQSNIGGIIGNCSYTSFSITNCLYLEGTAESGIGKINDTSIKIDSSATLPNVLQVINGDNAFVDDDGYPILAWQKKDK